MSTNGPMMTAEKHDDGVLIASRSLDNEWQDLVISVDQALDLIVELQAVTRSNTPKWFYDGGEQVALVDGYTLCAGTRHWAVWRNATVESGPAINAADAQRKALEYVREQA